ncbi:hypothetical protein C4B63_481g9 [Trypanosoma cruzi]|uniref:Uncharacterized protein n=1 Tax=Trypanosoma cruzi TaxID=5693 RepID=A0A2V2UG19_TRYCR|nr:hypothetical protein C4B63_481g9 [Trypanosoma cruzi]
MLEKSEEMVQLLEEARQAECNARSELFNREEALLELQRRRDDDLRELEAVTHAHRNLLHAIRQPREGMTDDNAEESFSEAERVQGIERHAVQLESENIALREEMAQRAVAHREAMEGLKTRFPNSWRSSRRREWSTPKRLGSWRSLSGCWRRRVPPRSRR